MFLGCSQQASRSVPSFIAKIHQSLKTAYATVRQHIFTAHRQNKDRYDKQRPFSPFQVGDQVWLFTPVVKPGTTKKFTSQWRGPYTVLDRINKVNYRIKLVGLSVKPQVVHNNRLKLCYGTPQQITTPILHPPSTVQTQPLYTEIVQIPASSSVGGYTTPPSSSTTTPSSSTTTPPSSSTSALPSSSTSALPSSSTNSTTATSTSGANSRPQREHRPPARYNDFVAP